MVVCICAVPDLGMGAASLAKNGGGLCLKRLRVINKLGQSRNVSTYFPSEWRSHLSTSVSLGQDIASAFLLRRTL